MSRRRSISTDISLDEAVADVAGESEFAALLYTWMIPHADDDATITGDPRRLLAMVIPHLRKRTPDDVRRALDLMESCGLFELRTPKTIYFDPAAFYRYQTYVPTGKRRVAAAITEECRKSPTNPASLSLSPSPSPSHDKPLDLVGIELRDKRVPDSVMGYWRDKVGRSPTSADLNSLAVLCKRYPSQVVTLAIGQAVLQGARADNFALITTIAKAEVAP